MSNLELSKSLVRACEKAASLASVQWLTQAHSRVCGPASENSRADFQNSFAAAGKKMGQKVLRLEGGPDGFPEEVQLLFSMRGIDEIVRGALLLAEVERSTDVLGFLNEFYARAGEREKVAILRTLPLLPEPERFVAIAAQAARSSSQAVFEALALDSPLPAARFDARAFDQLVLKVLYSEASLLRVHGLEKRATEALKGVLRSYADERRSSGRPVPIDIGSVLSMPTAPGEDPAAPAL
jgi:hypothetical protein